MKESCGTAPEALTLLDLSSEGELCSSASDRMRFGLNRLRVITASGHSRDASMTLMPGQPKKTEETLVRIPFGSLSSLGPVRNLAVGN